MLTSITPLGERGRRHRWGMTAGWFVAGSTAGGLLTGVLLALPALALGQLAATPLLVAGLVLVLLALLVDIGVAPLPRWRRQVDEDWMRRYRGWVYGGGWGLQLGMGVVTIVTAAVGYLVWVLALLTGSVVGAVSVGLVFGLVRGLSVLTVRGVNSPQSLTALARGLQRRLPLARRLVVGWEAAAALVLVVALV